MKMAMDVLSMNGGLSVRKPRLISTGLLTKYGKNSALALLRQVKSLSYISR
tara:strand:+ start:503 stop:655 length:153 start_codon:yes stop_codon:yes gene_type:complete